MTSSAVARSRPESNEHATYFERYTKLVPEGDIVSILTKQMEETQQVLQGIDEARAGFRYAPDKWSIKQLIGHLADTERIFSYRALRFARNDPNKLTGFDQDTFVSGGDFDSRTLSDLAVEFENVRKATLDLLKPLSDEAWLRRGIANDDEISVRALAFITAGHEIHHMQILKERYLSAATGAQA
jgi:DinB superfamily